ncbi:hypothetical protein H6F89_13830 [Cyanobacteria bacterium FACHB-63]|nr:hypothetical protein [Cyanobacteria bacterium FACHB-63]
MRFTSEQEIAGLLSPKKLCGTYDAIAESMYRRMQISIHIKAVETSLHGVGE